MRSVVGEDLQRLFAAFEAGRIGEDEFASRKAALLAWSRCRLSLATPRRLQFQRADPAASSTRAAAAGGLAARQ